jgi:hypothetical protein
MSRLRAHWGGQVKKTHVVDCLVGFLELLSMAGLMAQPDQPKAMGVLESLMPVPGTTNDSSSNFHKMG